MLRSMEKWDIVDACFLQLAKPGFPEVVKNIVERGAKKIVVMPLLLFSGNHVLKDIPDEIKNEKRKYPEIQFYYANSLGADERIARIAADRIDEAINQGLLITKAVIKLTMPAVTSRVG